MATGASRLLDLSVDKKACSQAFSFGVHKLDSKNILKQAKAAELANRHQDALNILLKGMKSFPGDKNLVLAFGFLHIYLKKFADAQAIFSKLVEPGGKMQLPVAIGLSKSLLGLERYDQARKILTTLYQQSPDNLDVLIGLAQCARHRNELDDANKLLTKAVGLNKDNKLVRHEQARVALAQKQADVAITLLEANIDRKEPHGDSIDLWLETLREQKRELYLRTKLQEFAKKHPERPEFVFGLGVTYSRAGEIDNARKMLTKASQMLVGNFRILYELSVLERLAGNIAQSQTLLEQVLAAKPDHCAALRTYGVDYKYAYGDPVFTRLNTVAAEIENMAPMEQIQLHFAQGKAFDDVAELSSAFKHYAVGGLKKRKLDKYVEGNSAKMFSIMKQIVNKDTLPPDLGKGYKDQTPTFILGMPRSGTSLMEQILSSHPDIYGAGELKHITSTLENIEVQGRRIKLGDIEAAFAYDQNASFAERGQWYSDMLKSIAGKPYKCIVDKMPGNFNFVGLIHTILPEAKIIHSRRHPVETCLSIYRILFAEGHQWSYDLGQLGRYYKHYWDLMQHWREQYPGVMYEVRYEDNVADVEGQARKLIDYLGLEWNENCLNFYNTDRPVKTASASQVRKPIYTTSTNRWRKYEPHLGPLMAEIGDIVAEYEAELAQSTPKS